MINSIYKKLLVIIIVLAVVVGGVGYEVYQTFFAKGTLVVNVGVSKATVTILGPEGIQSGLTDQNGKITFKDLPKGDYQVIADKEGYFSMTSGRSVAKGGTSTIEFPPIHHRVILTPIAYPYTDPSAIIIKQGSTGTVAITVTSYNNFEGEVHLNLLWSEGKDGDKYENIKLPWGVTAEFYPANITLTAGGEAQSTVTIAVSSTATKDTYRLDIQLGWQVDVIAVEYEYKDI
jgi:hypothetical protein